MSFTSEVIAAIARLSGFYNGENYNPSTNAGGMRNGGHRLNFAPALQDQALVADAVAAEATAAGASATAAAASASAASGSAGSAATAKTAAEAAQAAAEAAAAGITWKVSVKAASTANLTLSGTQTVDGVALVASDRVLVKDQSTAANNGIYIVAAGAWTRATDANSWTELVGAAVITDQGTVNADVIFICTSNSGGTLGTTAITFSRITLASLAGQVATSQIADDAVTYDKIQNVSATDKILGRSTAGSGVVEEIECTAAGRAILDDANAAAQRTTLGVYDEIVDSSYAQMTTYSNTTSAIPLDDTPPQSGEGVSVLSVTHSAKTTTDKLRIRAVVPVGFNDTATVAIGALFVGTGTVGASAVSAAAATCGNTGGMQSIVLTHEYTPGTISSQTIEVRVGTGGAGGVGINGTNAARLFGGVTKATITVEEIRA